MRIRHAEMADLEELTRLEARCFPQAEAADRETFRGRLLAYPHHFWLLEDEGVILSAVNGLVSDLPKLSDVMFEDTDCHRENGAWQMIFGVETLPEYQGRGYAGLLMRRVIEDARRQGRKGLVLTCKEKLIPFYERFGYLNEGISQSVHGGAVWYDMRLAFARGKEGAVEK